MFLVILHFSTVTEFTGVLVIIISHQHTDARYSYSNSVRLSVCFGILWKRINILS